MMMCYHCRLCYGNGFFLNIQCFILFSKKMLAVVSCPLVWILNNMDIKSISFISIQGCYHNSSRFALDCCSVFFVKATRVRHCFIFFLNDLIQMLKINYYICIQDSPCLLLKFLLSILCLITATLISRELWSTASDCLYICCTCNDEWERNVFFLIVDKKYINANY